jgi:hypothetical protein
VNRSTPVALLLVTVIIMALAWRYTHPLQYNEEGFSIILTKDSSQVLSDADIQRYNATSYELILTEECAERLRSLREPLMGAFVIIVDGEEDLRGVFVPPVVSRSYPSTEVVILYPSMDSDYRIMKIQMGYPWDQPEEVDPRRSSKMIQHFDMSVRLIR